MERLGHWLARRAWETVSPQELEERVEAVVARVDLLEDRVHTLEHLNRAEDGVSKLSGHDPTNL